MQQILFHFAVLARTSDGIAGFPRRERKVVRRAPFIMRSSTSRHCRVRENREPRRVRPSLAARCRGMTLMSLSNAPILNDSGA